MNFRARRVTLPVITPITLQKRVIKVFNDDNTSRALEVPADVTARDVCQLFVLKKQCVDDHSWTLFEQLAHLGIERTIEDHESMMEVQSGWSMDSSSRFCFRKHYAKYDFFKRPLDFFPEHMVSVSSETSDAMAHSQLIQMFLNSSMCSEVCGYLHAREQGKKSWKKFYFVLRRSGLYFSSKGMSKRLSSSDRIPVAMGQSETVVPSTVPPALWLGPGGWQQASRYLVHSFTDYLGLPPKEPRHLQFVAEFGDSDAYTMLSPTKMHGTPTAFAFCIKPHKSDSPRDLKVLCADDERSRTCWVTAVRLFKHGMQLYENFLHPHLKQKASPMRSISENSLVAMDFSGHQSRVIENPSEALSVAVEEGLSWKRKSYHRLSSHGSSTALRRPLSNIGIHRAQPWFHSRLSRDEATHLIGQQGLSDGVFLVRDSQSNPKAFVLSLCHAQRIKHFQILPVETEGGSFFSLDDGQTRFTDLIQLVEFYLLNRGSLPCKLQYQCARVAL